MGSPQGTKSSTLYDDAYRAIRTDILDCRLLPGAKLRIGDLCERLGMSLGVVREALSRLVADGLVQSEPQRGFTVTPVSRRDLLDLTRARVEIEGVCLRAAMVAGDVAWESGIVAAFYRLSRVAERDPADRTHLSDHWSTLHAGFHQSLVLACDSPWLLRLRTMLFEQSELYRKLSVPVRNGDRDVNAEHEALMAAVVARNADRACEEMRLHLERTTTILLCAPALLDHAAEQNGPAAFCL